MPDLFTPLEGETLLAFLVRTRPDYEWTDDDGTVEPYAPYTILGMWETPAIIRPRLTSAEWDVIVAAAFPPPVIVTPPDLVRELGDEIAWTAPFVHTGSCHGLIYTTSTHGQAVKGYSVGDYTALTGAGVVSFLDDDGNAEPYQYLNWDRGLIVPKTMSVATGFVWSPNVALHGTVTPFSLVPAT